VGIKGVDKMIHIFNRYMIVDSKEDWLFQSRYGKFLGGEVCIPNKSFDEYDLEYDYPDFMTYPAVAECYFTNNSSMFIKLDVEGINSAIKDFQQDIDLYNKNISHSAEMSSYIKDKIRFYNLLIETRDKIIVNKEKADSDYEKEYRAAKVNALRDAKHLLR